jgi:hypothetical protein
MLVLPLGCCAASYQSSALHKRRRQLGQAHVAHVLDDVARHWCGRRRVDLAAEDEVLRARGERQAGDAHRLALLAVAARHFAEDGSDSKLKPQSFERPSTRNVSR